jgi:hypothetical protein
MLRLVCASQCFDTFRRRRPGEERAIEYAAASSLKYCGA